jgi:hypothetical protein
MTAPPRFSKAQIKALSSGSAEFERTWVALEKRGFVVRSCGFMVLTDAGRAALKDHESPS